LRKYPFCLWIRLKTCRVFLQISLLSKWIGYWFNYFLFNRYYLKLDLDVFTLVCIAPSNNSRLGACKGLWKNSHFLHYNFWNDIEHEVDMKMVICYETVLETNLPVECVLKMIQNIVKSNILRLETKMSFIIPFQNVNKRFCNSHSACWNMICIDNYFLLSLWKHNTQ
jgi:hypothetical protein